MANIAINKYFMQVYKKLSPPLESSYCYNNSNQDNDTLIPDSLLDDSDSLPKDQAYLMDFDISEDRYLFDTQKNIIAAINVFMNCINKGFYPPNNILLYLSKQFELALHPTKFIHTDICLKDGRKRDYSIIKRNIDLIVEIDTLRYYFKLSLEDSIYAVSARLAASNIHLKDTTIKDIYAREGKSQLENSLMLSHEDIKWLDNMSTAFKNNKLTEYIDKYPEEVKNFIRNKCE